jgi:hypothetical protein
MADTTAAAAPSAAAPISADVDQIASLDDAAFSEMMDLGEVMRNEERHEPEPGVQHELSDGEDEETGDEEIEGGEKPPAKPDEKKPATEFTIFQGGEQVEPPDDLQVKFAVKGKEYDLPLDRVVRLAKSGFHNEELVKQVDAAERREQDFVTQVDSLEKKATQYLATVRRLIEDDDYLAKVREENEAANTPEERARRAEQRADAAVQERERDRGLGELQQFVTQTLAPRLDALLEKYPDVSSEELQERFFLYAERFKVNGYIPRRNFAKLDEIMSERIEVWAETQQNQRSAIKERDQLRKTDTERKKLAPKLALKMAAARALKPAPRTVSSTAAGRRAASEALTADDAADLVVREALG